MIMNEAIKGLSLLIIIVNVLISYKGFRDASFFERYKFEVDGILIGKQYNRMFLSGFLHVGWVHLLFNMMAFYSFSFEVGDSLGLTNMLLIYFGSLIGGNLLALYIHKNHGDYSAVGASGAVSGIVFSSIVMFPHHKIGLVFIDGTGIPGWIFGIIYILISIYGVKSKVGNIGHEAHLGGAITGILISLMVKPSIMQAHPLIIASFLLPFTLFLILVVKRPEFLLIDNYFSYKVKQYKLEQGQDLTHEEELDALLDKINKKGMDSLSKFEKKRLEELSERIN
jgi:membrane associated rhomboid family serine protease